MLRLEKEILILPAILVKKVILIRDFGFGKKVLSFLTVRDFFSFERKEVRFYSQSLKDGIERFLHEVRSDVFKEILFLQNL